MDIGRANLLISGFGVRFPGGSPYLVSVLFSIVSFRSCRSEHIHRFELSCEFYGKSENEGEKRCEKSFDKAVERDGARGLLVKMMAEAVRGAAAQL